MVNNANSLLLRGDSPRDENIYLPYKVIDTGNPTFDWVVYNQSAWDALDELAKYHRNTFCMTKQYNTDIYSNLDDLRETLVIGNKAGYYKYTDAYSLSNKNIGRLKKSVTKYNDKIKPLIKNDLNDFFNIKNVDITVAKPLDNIIEFFQDEYNNTLLLYLIARENNENTDTIKKLLVASATDNAFLNSFKNRKFKNLIKIFTEFKSEDFKKAAENYLIVFNQEEYLEELMYKINNQIGDPREDYSTAWNQIDNKAQEKAAAWFNYKKLKDFFDSITTDQEEAKERFAYWEKHYKEMISTVENVKVKKIYIFII